MATAKDRGIPSLASALIRPTTTQTQPEKPEPVEATDDQAEGEQGGGSTQNEPKPRARSRRTAASEVAKGRKISLPDSVFDRLQLTAIQRRKTLSAVATEILDRNLPKLRIERDN